MKAPTEAPTPPDLPREKGPQEGDPPPRSLPEDTALPPRREGKGRPCPRRRIPAGAGRGDLAAHPGARAASGPRGVARRQRERAECQRGEVAGMRPHKLPFPAPRGSPGTRRSPRSSPLRWAPPYWKGQGPRRRPIQRRGGMRHPGRWAGRAEASAA